MKKLFYWVRDNIGWEINYYAREVRGFFYGIEYGIKSVIYWFPIIWKNRWWNPESLLFLIRHQLEEMEKNWVVNTQHESDEENKAQMQKVLERLEIIINFDDYYYNDLNKFSDKEYMESEKERYKCDCKIVFDTIRDNHQGWWS